MSNIVDRIDAYETRQDEAKGEGPIPFEKDKELIGFIKKVNDDIAKMAKKSADPQRRSEWIKGKLKASIK